MPAKARDVRRMLVGKLHAVKSERSNHEWYQVVEEGTLIANLPLSRGADELDDRLLSSISRQLHVNRKQMRNLLDCPWSWEDYITHVIGSQ